MKVIKQSNNKLKIIFATTLLIYLCRSKDNKIKFLQKVLESKFNQDLNSKIRTEMGTSYS